MVAVQIDTIEGNTLVCREKEAHRWREWLTLLSGQVDEVRNNTIVIVPDFFTPDEQAVILAALRGET